jgi:hypothetical protein
MAGEIAWGSTELCGLTKDLDDTPRNRPVWYVPTPIIVQPTGHVAFISFSGTWPRAIDPGTTYEIFTYYKKGLLL